ncbi:hypothetical protein Tco_0338929, partial [Tanacetum coccineum]
YTRHKTNKPAGTLETSIPAGTQDPDSDSEVDEQVIVVPSFPSNSFVGPFSSTGPSVIERNADYAEELAGIGSAGGVSAGSTYAGSDPAGGHLAGPFQTACSYDPAALGEPAALGDPAASTSVSADFIHVHADESTLPPGQFLGSSENTKRFPVPSDV